MCALQWSHEDLTEDSTDRGRGAVSSWDDVLDGM